MQNITGYHSCEQLIAEIKARWNGFIIDDIVLKQTVFEELKSFRDACAMPKYEFIHLNNRRAPVPKDFQSLTSATYVVPDRIISPILPKEKIIQSREYSLLSEGFLSYVETGCCESRQINCQDTCTCMDKLIYEEQIIEHEPVLFCYKDPVNVCRVDYVQGATTNKTCPYEISYFNNEFISSIEKGTIKIKYNGIPTDEDGVPLIPVAHDDSIRKFLRTAMNKALIESPTMIAQKEAGFVDIYKILAPVIYGNYEREKSKAQSELSRLSMRDMVEYVEERRRLRYNRFFSKYSGL